MSVVKHFREMKKRPLPTVSMRLAAQVWIFTAASFPGLVSCAPVGASAAAVGGSHTLEMPGPKRAPGQQTEDRADIGSATSTVPLVLDLQSAVLMALDNNVGFRVERLRPAISRAAEQEQNAMFDTTVASTLRGGFTRDDIPTGNATTNASTDTEIGSVNLGVRKFLSTGTSLEVDVGAELRNTEDGVDTETSGMDWGVTLTQSLLRGRGTDANLARLRQARLDTEMSVYELRGAAEALVAQVEQAYWDCILAERSLQIYEESLKIAAREVEEVKARIQVGQVAETELAAAAAEMAGRRVQLIEAQGNLAKRRLTLIWLLGPSGTDSTWTRDLALSEAPEIETREPGDVEACVAEALNWRAELQQARLKIRSGDIEVVRTRNGLLPKLDLFIGIGGSRYANSFADGRDADVDAVEYTAGVIFEIPLGNRAARAMYRQAMLSRQQTEAAFQNMEQLAQVDVRSAYVDVERTQEQMKATRATRDLREKTLGNEREKFRVGRSTMFLVSQARRDFVASQIAAVEAIVQYRKALLNLQRHRGTLLSRRGIEVE